jgi:predicted kinase
MLELIMCRGLIASGKTTWAKEWVLSADVNHRKRVNKDDLRAMLDVDRYSKGAESIVLDARDFLVKMSLANGISVVVDDTNFNPKHEEALRAIAKDYGAVFKIQEFEVSLAEALRRNKQRKKPVPEDAIRKMWKEYCNPMVAPKSPDRGLAQAIIVDIDGTLADHSGVRGHHDYDRVLDDKPVEHIVNLVNKLSSDYFIIMVSGRPDSCSSDTMSWLSKHRVACNSLHMRTTGDFRKDSIVKKEIYDEYIGPNYDVQFVLDDRDQVVKMWREECKLPCLQVNYGDF